MKCINKMETKKPQEDKLEKNFEKYKREIDKLEKKYAGRLTPQDIVRESCKERSPLYDWFDWQDSSAGEKWRLHQARLLLNSIKVKVMFEDGEKSYRKYLNVRVKQDGEYKRFYVETDKIMKNEDMKNQILERAMKEIEYWQRTYEDYNELEDIFKGVKRTKKKLKKILVTN